MHQRGHNVHSIRVFLRTHFWQYINTMEHKFQCVRVQGLKQGVPFKALAFSSVDCESSVLQWQHVSFPSLFTYAWDSSWPTVARSGEPAEDANPTALNFHCYTTNRKQTLVLHLGISTSSLLGSAKTTVRNSKLKRKQQPTLMDTPQ